MEPSAPRDSTNLAPSSRYITKWLKIEHVGWQSVPPKKLGLRRIYEITLFGRKFTVRGFVF